MKIKFLLMIICINLSFAQVSSLIQGVVTDKNNNSVETDLYFTSENEQYIINTFHDGTFSNSIKPGEIYEISVKGYLVSNETGCVSIPANDKYQEITHNIIIEKYYSGLIIMTDNIFENNSTDFVVDIKELIFQIRDLMNFHSTKFNIILNASDIKNNKAEILKDRRKKMIMELFKYGLDDRRIKVEINQQRNAEGNFELVVNK